MDNDNYQVVARVSDIPEGGFRCFDVNGTGIVLARLKGDGGIHAVRNMCSHALATFDDGRLRGHRLMCPLHGASFDVRSGAVLGKPAFEPIAAFPVRVTGEEIAVLVE